MPDLSDQIEDAAEGPAEVTADGLTIKQQPIPDLIQADQYLNERTAVTNRKRGLRFNKLSPPGTV